jgi:hypothetical protein
VSGVFEMIRDLLDDPVPERRQEQRRVIIRPTVDRRATENRSNNPASGSTPDPREAA